jgi:hypothetical protein
LRDVIPILPLKEPTMLLPTAVAMVSANLAVGGASLDELADIASARDNGITSIEYACSFDEFETSSHGVDSWSCYVVATPARWFVREISSIASDQPGPTSVIESAWNGQATVTHNILRGTARVVAELNSSQNPNTTPLMQAMMLAYPGLLDSKMVARTLGAELQGEEAKLLGGTEVVHGRECRVVQIGGDGAGHDMKLWLDPERQCLPIQQHHFIDGKLTMSWEVLESEQIGGYWIPTVALRSSFASGGSAEIVANEQRLLLVEVDAQGMTVAGVNSLADPGVFNLENGLPPGTTVITPEGSYIASRTNYQRLDDTACVLAKSMPSARGGQPMDEPLPARVHLVSSESAVATPGVALPRWPVGVCLSLALRSFGRQALA